jgi:hypothetical protein
MDRGATARHELGNVLGIVLANLEGMIDGIVPPTPERLEALAQALRRSKELLAELERESAST